MRSFILLLFVFHFVRLNAQARVSVAQIEEFLSSHQAARDSDDEIAHRLGTVQLAEQLTDARLALLSSRIPLGPKGQEQLGLLAITSVFAPPVPSDLPSTPAPDPSQQQRILQSARAYAGTAVDRLPDFMATRTTQVFDSVPRSPERSPHPEPQIQLHFVREHRRQVTVRSGREVGASPETGGAPLADSEGLTTWGEFGPILSTIFADSMKGTIVWSRWQNDADGKQLAVFHYSVPKSASHDLIDLCCYLQFRDTPAYHGDLYIDPTSGAISQLTIENELGNLAPIRLSEMSVRYGPVEIGGKHYICPLRGVAVVVLHDAQLERRDGVGLERFINVVHFTDYHKFGSTARILTSK